MKPANKSPRRHNNDNANEISSQSSIIAQQQGTNRRGMGGWGNGRGGGEREGERGRESVTQCESERWEGRDRDYVTLKES